MNERRRRYLTFLLLGFISLYVLIMSRTRFRVNLRSIVAWVLRNSLLVHLRTKWLWVEIPLQSLGFIFNHIFGPKKGNLLCPVFVFHRGISNGISDFILYSKNESLNTSWISRYNSILVLKNDIQIHILKNDVLLCLKLGVTLFF